MKASARAVPAFLAMLLLLALAFGIGAYRGMYNERLQVELALSSLQDVLETRVEMGNNLLTVAGRHLDGEDPLVKAVREDISLLSGEGSLPGILSANQRLARDGKALLAQLESSPSVQTNEQDLFYVNALLPRGFEQSAQWADAAQYNQAARAYNARLKGTITGLAASLLGVEPAALFEEAVSP